MTGIEFSSELIFDEAMPATYHAFVENGRVAP